MVSRAWWQHPVTPTALSLVGFGFIACDALKSQHEGDVYLNSRLRAGVLHLSQSGRQIGDFKPGQEVKFQAFLFNGRLQGRLSFFNMWPGRSGLAGPLAVRLDRHQ